MGVLVRSTAECARNHPAAQDSEACRLPQSWLDVDVEGERPRERRKSGISDSCT